jgi:NAD(P)-dependent dehydrogenase (short-subunit alcohol dehydrogenase family)
MAFDLTGRVALVTGSSRGIGRAIARALADAGAIVAVHGKQPSEALEAALAEVAASSSAPISVTGDLVDSASTRAIVTEVASELGRLDILVNNAGHVVPCSADDMTEKTWDSVIDVNLRAAFFCAQAASREMRKNQFGRIINISSQGGEVAIPTYVHYGVSKAGLNVMTRYLAVEWAPFGITVNTVSPAFVRTDLTAEVFRQLPDLYEDQLARVPKGRMCEPEEVAAAVLYLASAEADFTTGEILHVDGGYLAL